MTQTNTWQRQAAERQNNRSALENARRVALRVLDELDEKNMTQADLAAKMGVKRQQVGKIVKGQENFTFETIEKLEKALDISLMTIHLGEEEGTAVQVPGWTSMSLDQPALSLPMLMSTIATTGTVDALKAQIAHLHAVSQNIYNYPTASLILGSFHDADRWKLIRLAASAYLATKGGVLVTHQQVAGTTEPIDVIRKKNFTEFNHT
jgi:antitoxin component HigA of HigAB toxin-antitoxin module